MWRGTSSSAVSTPEVSVSRVPAHSTTGFTRSEAMGESRREPGIPSPPPVCDCAAAGRTRSGIRLR